MRKAFVLFLLGIFVSSGMALWAEPKFLPATTHGIPGEYIVLLSDDAVRQLSIPGAPTSLEGLIGRLTEKYGGTIARIYRHGRPGFLLQASEAAARRLAADTAVEIIEQNATIETESIDSCYSDFDVIDPNPDYPPPAREPEDPILKTDLGSPQPIECSDPDPRDPGGPGGFPPLDCIDNWGLDRIDGLRNGLYSFSRTGRGVHVYVIDLGINASHSEFLNLRTVDPADYRVGNGTNAAARLTDSNEVKNDIRDCSGNSHGTHVAAIVGGNTFGVAKEAILHPVKFQNTCSPTRQGTRDTVINGIDWILANHILPAVVNFSGGNGSDSSFRDGTIAMKFKELLDRKIPVVQSAGNQRDLNGQNACVRSLGSYDELDQGGLIVAGGIDVIETTDPATGQVETIYGRWIRELDDPSYGLCSGSFKDCGSNSGSCVDVWAPAAHIVSATRSGSSATACRLSGTSMAAPHVTGVVALQLEGYVHRTAEISAPIIKQAVIEGAECGELDQRPGSPYSIGADSPNLLVNSEFSGTLCGNLRPVAVDDPLNTTIDTPITFLASALLQNDTDPDGDEISFFGIATLPQHGVLSIDGVGPKDSIYRYTPNPGYYGTDTFQYMIQDARRGSGTATVSITVLPTGCVAHPDVLMAHVDTTLEILASQLSANDCPQLTFLHTGEAEHGTLALGGIGPDDILYHYTPPPGFVGDDTFEYKVGPNGDPPYTWVPVTIMVRDYPPAAAFTATCTGLTCSFNATASSDDGGALSYSWDFGDDAEATGVTASHTYAVRNSYLVELTVTDTGDQTSTTTQIVTVDALPVASFTYTCTQRDCNFDASGSTDDDAIETYTWDFGDGSTGTGKTIAHSYATSGEKTVKLTVKDTFGQPDDETKIVRIDLDPIPCFTWSRDGLTINFNASCSTDDLGISTYAWTFGDGTTGSGKIVSHTYATSNSFPVVLTVTDTGNHSKSTMPPTTVTPDARPVANFTWSCTQRTCTFNGTSSTDNAPIVTWEWTLGDGNVKYGSIVTHTYAVGGPYNVKLKVTDSVNQWDDELKPIAVNRPPVPANDSAVTNQNVAVDINVLANDSDPDPGDTISVSTWTQPAHGSVTKNANGTMRYTPAAGYTGPDSFKYRISDGKEPSVNEATVSLDVRVPNRPPDARDDGWYTYQNVPTNIPYSNLLENDYDPNGDALTVTGINTAGLAGTLDCSFGTYCRYTPHSWFIGTTSFTYIASDGKGGTDPATVRIKVRVTNGVPVPQDDILETAYNTALTFTRDTLLLNDSDPDGDVLSVSWVYRAPLTALGTVSCSAANYVCTYTPPAGFTGVDVLSYRATDGIGFTDARIRILVRPPNPTVLDAREDQTFFTSYGGTFLSYTWMTSNDYDPEGGALTVVSIDTTGLLGSLDCTTYPNGCQYTRGTSDPTRFRYTVRDPQGNLATTTVTLKPGNWSFNLNPVIANDQLSTRMNTPLVFSIFDVLRNDYDPDNDQLNAMFNFGSTYGRVLCTASSYICTYTPNANFTGTDTLTYYANDGNNAIQGTVTMTVQPLIAKDAQILSQSVPVSMFAGQSYPVSLRIKNVGTTTWSPIGPQCNAFRLGSVNPYDNSTWGQWRTELPATVAPGGEVTINFTVTAPSTPGTYNFQRRMVHECVVWFGDLSPNMVVSVSL